MSAAKFPVARNLSDFDFKQAEVKEEQIKTLYSGHFIAEKRNIVLVGGTGYSCPS
jgi:DNA replication protein DnaC